jgi:hypothetical protein
MSMFWVHALAINVTTVSVGATLAINPYSKASYTTGSRLENSVTEAGRE